MRAKLESDGAKLSRIEAKLTRLCHSLGFDTFGNPHEGVVLSKEDTYDIVMVLDAMLDAFDKLPYELLPAKLYDRAEHLYNRIIAIRNGRWPTQVTTTQSS